MKKLILLIAILSFVLINFAQVADSLDVEQSDTTIIKKDKTIRIMFGDKELLKVDINADVFDLDIDENAKGDTTKLRIGKKNIIIIENDDEKDYSYFDDEEYEGDDDDDDYDYKSKKFKGHWSGIELGMNNYLNSDFELALPTGGEFLELNTSKSVEFSLNFMEKAFPIYKNRLGIVTGMGIKWNNYHFDNNITLDPSSNPLDTIDIGSVNYSKNKLGVTYLTIPLLLEYQIPVGKKNKPIYFSTGVIGGLKIGSRTKQEYSLDGQNYDYKTKEDYNLSPYTYSVTARLGYKNVNVFANYSMVSLFEKNKGPELYPFTIGLSFIN